MLPEHIFHFYLFIPVVLKLQFSSESPGGPGKPQVAGPMPRICDPGK